MKKVLFATTALVATAGVAAADVTLSGSAEMGIFSADSIDDSATGTPGAQIDGETQFFTDIDVTFTMSGTTDNGLTFGATVDLDESDDDGGDTGSGAFSPEDDGGVTIFIAGNFGTLTMGDTDGALDWALTEAWVGNAGSLADDETTHAGALGSYADGAYDGQILRYEYTFDDFGFAISTEIDDDGAQDPGYAIGFRYGFDFGGGSLDLGLGYQVANPNSAFTPGELDGTLVDLFLGGDGIDDDTLGDGFENVGVANPGDEITVLGLSAAATFDNGLSAGLQYSQWDFAGNDVDHIGVGAGYTFDAFTVSANYGVYQLDGGPDISGYGLAAAYDLGGGASVHLGYGVSDYSDIAGAPDSVESFSLGVAMSF
ncbi:porin [Boseongicola sp. H5]|uniref:porin n=1 Tax=Boseongicola sp. H5 TaxID=2763261 RepID=UPI001D0B287E|nr:porin [Boseongicola sp. H5]